MRLNCTALLGVILLAKAAAAQPLAPGLPATGEATFNVIIKGQQIGRETASVSHDASGWVITSSGRLDAPIDLTITRFQMRYGNDWQPLELKIDAIQQKTSIALATSFSMTTAINEVTQQGKTVSKEDQISARTIVVPNHYWGAYEALAARLWTSAAGTVLPLYVAPNAEVKMTVQAVAPQTLTGPDAAINARRYDLVIANVGADVQAVAIVDDRARLVRFEIPAVGMVVVRDDAAGVAVRATASRNPTDVDVKIPANGFTIAATLTTPPTVAGRLRSPGIVLIAGSGPMDRDENVAGIQIFTQLAAALANAGAIVLRYDKRGIGQSGGRPEAATLADYTDDAIAVVKWLAKRPEVDQRKIIVVGHSEGAAVALLAAAREKAIDGVVSIAGPGTKGEDLILEQQQHVLAQTALNEQDRQEKIALQKKIQDAVLGRGDWNGVPPELRKQADVPWFRSLLAYDPAQVMPKVKQPILIIQGDLDTQVPKAHADKLAELAKMRKKAAAPTVEHIPGVNHLLVPATTGEVTEYRQLTEQTISPKIASSIADWIKMSVQ